VVRWGHETYLGETELLALREGSPSGQEELQGAKKVKKKSWQQQQADSGSMQIGEGIKNVNACEDNLSICGAVFDCVG